jgi:phage tail-like protein
MSALTDIGKKLGVIRPAYKPIKLSTTPYSPPPPGQLATWQRETAQATPGKLTKLTPRKVQVMTLVAVGAVLVIGFRGLFPQRKVKKTLLVSNFSVNSPGQPAKGSVAGRRDFDPYGDFNFVVQIEGIAAGAFQKVDGLTVEVDAIEYKDSLDPHPRKRPGIHRYGNLKLTKGVIENTALWDWCCRLMAGEIDRRNGTIHVLPDDGDRAKPEVSFNFVAAWPCKWSGLRVDGKGGATLVEEIELVVDRWERAKG